MQVKHIVLVSAFVLAPFALRAEDKAPEPAPAPEVKKEVEVIREEPVEVVDEDQGGNKLSRFFIHKVGGGIGHGLKSAPGKISHGIKPQD